MSFRLKQSGIDNIIYIIEGSKAQSSMPMCVLMQAAVNSLIQDDFTVKFTKNHYETAFYLSNLTRLLSDHFKEKYLVQHSKEDLKTVASNNKKIDLMGFDEFNQCSSKLRVFNVREMLIKQLLHLKGLSLDGTLAIVEHYPTPSLLRRAFIHASYDGGKLLADLKHGLLNRKLGPVLSKNICQLYTNHHLE